MNTMHSVFEQDTLLLADRLRDVVSHLSCKYSDAPKRPMVYDIGLPRIKQAIVSRHMPNQFIDVLLYARQSMSNWSGEYARATKREVDAYLNKYYWPTTGRK